MTKVKEMFELKGVERATVKAELYEHIFATRVIVLTEEEKMTSSYLKAEKSLAVPMEESIKTIYVSKTGRTKEIKTLKSMETHFHKSAGIVAYSDGIVTMYETAEVAYESFASAVRYGEEFIVYIPSESELAEKEHALKEAKEELARIRKREAYLKEYIAKLEA